MKKLLSVLLILCIFLSLPVTGFAKVENDAQIQELLSLLNIMVGDPDGNFHPERPVTRAEFVKVAIMASPYRNAVPEISSTSPFGDVPYTLWSAPYIALASDSNLVSGYPDSTFRPDNTVLLEEGVTILLKTLGYSEADYGKVWPSGPMSLAKNLDLLEDMDKFTGDTLLRRDVMQLLYNTLNTKAKGSQNELINGLNYAYLEDTTVIATQNENKSISADRVLTSAGTYKIGDHFNRSLVGRKGAAFIKNGDTLELFIPNAQTSESYSVYKAEGNSITVQTEGNTSDLYLSNDLICYTGTQTANVSTAKFNPGDLLTVYYDALGNTDYVIHRKTDLNYTLAEDIVLLATQAEDKSVGKDSILTSAGTYKMNGIVNSSMVGQKGDAFIQNGDTIAVFMPDTQNIKTHPVFSVVNTDILIYENKSTSTLAIDDATVCYSGRLSGTLSDIRSQMQTGDTLKIAYDKDGDVDYLLHQKATLKGPYTVLSNAWMSQNGIAENASVIRNGKTVTNNEIGLHDVVYYAEDLNLVWAYSDSLTGIYEKATPNQDNPSSVVISGNTLSIESATAFKKLASGGNVRLGDTVTVLLGRDGAIADVVTGDTQIVQHGLLIGTGTKEYITESGNTEYAYYATVATADGNTLEVKTGKQDFESARSEIVTVTTKNGVSSIARTNQTPDLNGTFNATKMTLDGKAVAEDVKILDIVGYRNASRVPIYEKAFPQQLHNITLNKNNIAYVGFNQSGEIDELFLNDATGDLWNYGVVTEVNKSIGGMSASGQYVINVNGVEQTYSANSAFPINTNNAIQYILQNGALTHAKALSKLAGTVTNIDDKYVYMSSGQKYALGEGLAVYKRYNLDWHYQWISPEDVDLSSGSIQCYKENNKVRVIVWTVN